MCWGILNYWMHRLKLQCFSPTLTSKNKLYKQLDQQCCYCITFLLQKVDKNGYKVCLLFIFLKIAPSEPLCSLFSFEALAGSFYMLLCLAGGRMVGPSKQISGPLPWHLESWLSACSLLLTKLREILRKIGKYFEVVFQHLILRSSS